MIYDSVGNLTGDSTCDLTGNSSDDGNDGRASENDMHENQRNVVLLTGSTLNDDAFIVEVNSDIVVARKKTDRKRPLIIRPETKVASKDAASNFIAKDLRPYLAIEGNGLFELLTVAMKFGQSYRKATEDDLREVIPSRNTVRAHLEQLASQIKIKMKIILQNAKEVGGIATFATKFVDEK